MLLTDIFALLSKLITVLTWVFFGYQTVVALFGLKKVKQDAIKFEKNHKFTAVISARNEEKVIARVVHSLQEQDYPPELINIIVIADNCTDNTAEEAQKAGATVFERNDPSKAAKGFALEWLFDKLLNDKNFDSDAIAVFDADNVASRSFFTCMNRQLCCGSTMCQGYRDSLNPKDNWISNSYSIYFWFYMRFVLKARKNLNMSGYFGGTGFVITTDQLRSFGGWHTKDICEDIEFSMYSLAQGKRIDFVQDAKFFDEQPVTFKQSWNQRVRWGTGNWRGVKICAPCLIKNIGRYPVNCIDGLMLLLTVPSVLFGQLGLIFSFFSIIFAASSASMMWGFITGAGSIIASLAGLFLQGIIVCLIEGKKIGDNLKGIFGFPLFMLTFMVATVWGIVKPVKKWVHIEHGCNFEQVQPTEKKEGNLYGKGKNETSS